ncbi:MAG: helix-turn-helix transcriptional regulator [Hyphomicrobiales bacterium]|nr:helix-turn-helix transcriptional regulator [Hyphomicrobiales bacterium]
MGGATANFERFKRHFAKTLKELSSSNGSINRVCADLKINRQQFAKYLSGATLPSVYILQRVIDYFDVDPKIFFIRKGVRQTKRDQVVAQTEQAADINSGFYLAYCASPAHADAVEIGLWRFERSANTVLCYGQLPSGPGRGGLVGYTGVITAMGPVNLLKAKTANGQSAVIIAMSRLEFSPDDFVAAKIGEQNSGGAMFGAPCLFRHIGVEIDVSETLRQHCGVIAIKDLSAESQTILEILSARTSRLGHGFMVALSQPEG